MPTTGELARDRRNALRAMTDTAAVQRRTGASDNAGGTTLGAWTTVTGLEAVPCRYWQKGTEAREVEGTTRVQTLSLWGFAVPVGTDIRSTDRLLVGSRAFEVVQGGGHTDATQLVLTCMEVD